MNEPFYENMHFWLANIYDSEKIKEEISSGCFEWNCAEKWRQINGLARKVVLKFYELSLLSGYNLIIIIPNK